MAPSRRISLAVRKSVSNVCGSDLKAVCLELCRCPEMARYWRFYSFQRFCSLPEPSVAPRDERYALGLSRGRWQGGLADHRQAAGVAEDQHLAATHEHVEATSAHLCFKLAHRGEKIDPEDVAANEAAIASLFRLENLLDKFAFQCIYSLSEFSFHLVSFSVS